MHSANFSRQDCGRGKATVHQIRHLLNSRHALAVNAVLAHLKAFLESEITSATELFIGFLVCRHRVHLQVVHRLKCLITFETLELPDNGVGPLSVELEGVLMFEGSAADDTLVWFGHINLGG